MSITVPSTKAPAAPAAPVAVAPPAPASAAVPPPSAAPAASAATHSAPAPSAVTPASQAAKSSAPNNTAATAAAAATTTTKAAPAPSVKTSANAPTSTADGTAKAVPSAGSNTALTQDEMEKSAAAIAENLAGVMNADGRIEKSKEQAEALRKQAAGTLFPIFDRLGLEPSWGKDFAKNAKEIDEFNELRDMVCTNLSKKVRDPIDTTSKGANVYSDRVKKVWSRLVCSYKEGGEGGQTKADASAREAEKARKKATIAKAELLEHLIRAHGRGDTDAVESLLKSATVQWGKALED